MREILFRGKGNKKYNDGDWYYGVPIQCSDGDWQICTNCSKRTVITKTIGQYTGLTDRNGKKIFEGDIVKLTDDYNDFEWKAVVVFGNPGGAYCWGWNFLPIDGYKGTTDILMWVEMEATGAYCEVIGNIHDNPELLKGGNNNG